MACVKAQEFLFAAEVPPGAAPCTAALAGTSAAPLQRMRGACRQSTSAVTAQTAALLSRQLGSRVAKPPFCHSDLSVLSPATAHHLCIALHSLGISNKQKASLAFPRLISSAFILIWIFFISLFFLLATSNTESILYSATAIYFLPLVPGPSPLSANHGFGH